MKNKIVIRKIFHRERWRLAVFFNYDEKIRRIVTSITGAAYSSTYRCFYLDDTDENLGHLLKSLGAVADITIEEVKDDMLPGRQEEKEPVAADPKSSSLPEDLKEFHPMGKHEVPGSGGI